MIFSWHTLVLSTLLLTALSDRTQQSADSVADWDVFHRLVDNVDESSIHSILHQLTPKFKHGVFSKDRDAIEQVHSENPQLATRLLFLAKRQASLNTTTTTTTATAEAPTITATTIPPPTSVELPPTTPNAATPVSTVSGEVIYSSSAGGLVTVASSIAYVTYRQSSQEVLSTYTLPNGQLTTATSVVIVNAPVTGSIVPQTTPAGLQSSDSSSSRGHLKEIALMLGGAALVAMALQ